MFIKFIININNIDRKKSIPTLITPSKILK